MKKSKIIIILTVSFILGGCSLQSAGSKSEELGIQCLKDAQYEEAVSYFESAIEADIELETSYRGIGIAYLNLGKYEDAIDAFNKALGKALGKIGELEIDICYYKAVAQFKNKDMQGAIETYTSLIEYDGKNKESYYLRATAYLNQEKLELAKADFDAAISKDKDAYDMYINIYENLCEHGYEKEGAEYLNKAKNRLEKSGKNNLYLGRVNYYLKDYEAAKSNLEAAIKEGKKEGYLYLGQVFDKLEDTQTAQSNYSKYIENIKKSAEVYNSLGESLLKEKNYTGALQVFQSGIALKDEEFDKKLKFNEIITYEYLLEFKTAKEKMEEYLNLYPDDETAKREYEFLKTR
ncbi:tetratricopeptide repeat protein [Anaerosacchariphilus polymeriproducens]|uniref:Tetratricopeptide repeat protein n=1 Tax=Anaerosacchariphilus polymeriproducens TaxID=1812858 RepID=A0A371AXT4_9FIRM|nr:tetratricopeptide repeat protein [Anaerosacchariphilus polymeriproducens]RDU24384.1 tetratricopeptide repeat protein [Anaerosacchariphilus polymeriproducens]